MFDDDFDELFDEFKAQKKKSKGSSGSTNVENRRLWKDVNVSGITSTCDICRNSLGEMDFVDSCNNCNRFFHYKHIREWVKIKGSCPVCRKPLNY